MENEPLLTLQESWHYYYSSEGFEVGSPVRRIRLGLKGLPPAELEALFSALLNGVPVSTAKNSLSQISGLPASVVQSILKQLEERQALVTVQRTLTEMDTEALYDRQIRFFNAFGTSEMSGVAFNQRLQERKVLLVGLGGYGTWLALLCSRIGIRHIVGIDPDRVELSNLNRQVLYSRKDIGDLKVDACKRALLEVDRDICFEGYPVRINSPDDLLPFLAGADLIFNAFGYISTDRNRVLEHVALAALYAGVPSLVFSGSWVGPLTVPRQTACYWCLMSDNSVVDIVHASLPIRNNQFMPAFAPRIAMSSALAVWEASRFLTGIDRTLSLDHVITLDLFRYQRHGLIPVAISEKCPVCQEQFPQKSISSRSVFATSE
jgi:hypothetical protein